jgi:NADH-quinone oxidoreductase subunit G
MPKLTINGQEVEVAPGTTVLQAAQLLGIEIPVFCYHERLAIAGNCRMCLVEQEKAPKPIAACAMPAADGMVIHTESEKARKARKGVLEFLLINHPLDCPICDQGGECDLQDETMAYGFDRGRFAENKRAVRDKDLGPLVKTSMTRCIHCTRCIRFATEIAGVEDLGATARGEAMEVGTYVERTLTSELSANIIDLCPVGALTSKPYAYVARPWELRKTESVDVLDAVGSNIRVDSRGPEVMRILPRLNEDVNEEWLNDKSRFAAPDGLTKRRLDRPFVRKGGKLVEATWREAFDAIARRVAGGKVAAIAGDLCDAESMLALKDLMAGLGSRLVECRQDGARIDPSVRAGYLFNTNIAGIESADACLLVGTNPRWEAALVNARLRKRYLKGGFKVAAIGPALELTYPVEMLGRGPDVLAALAEGNGAWSEVLRGAERPMLILGQGALRRADGARVLGAARRLAEAANMVRDDWNGFNLLHMAASRVAGLDLGLVAEGGIEAIYDACRSEAVGMVWLLGADEIDTSRLGNAFVVYQGHTGDAGAHRADVILPGAAYTEKDGVYVNTEGRVQVGRRAVFPPGEAREDWRVLRAFSEVVARKLPYDSLGALRERLKAASPVFADLDDCLTRGAWGRFGEDGAPEAAPFAYPVTDFYLTDPISRASPTMHACSAAYWGQRQEERRTGTHG